MSSIATIICRCGNWTKVTDAGSHRTFHCAKCGAPLTLYEASREGPIKSLFVFSAIVMILLGGFALFNPNKWFAALPTNAAQNAIPADTRVNGSQPQPDPTATPPSVPEGPEPYTAPTPMEAAKQDSSLEVPKPLPPIAELEVARPSQINHTSPTEPPRPIPSPKTGALRRAHGAYEAPLRIETPIGFNYVIKVVNSHSGKELLLIYIRGGQSFDTRIPLGRYRFKVATGNDWYGVKRLFGADTMYSRLSQKDDPAGDVLKFLRMADGSMATR